MLPVRLRIAVLPYCHRYGRKIGVSVELQETQGIAYGIARTTIGWSQALLLAGVLLLGAGMVFDGRLAGQSLTTFVFYTNFVITASFDVGDQVGGDVRTVNISWCFQRFRPTKLLTSFFKKDHRRQNTNVFPCFLCVCV